MRRLPVLIPLVLVSLSITAPRQTEAQFIPPRPNPLAVFKDALRKYTNSALDFRPITITNDGVYPLISVKIDGRELIPSGSHLSVGAQLTESVNRFVTHSVDYVFGTPANNFYSDPFSPLWQAGYRNVSAGANLRIPDWTAEDVLTSAVVWHGVFVSKGVFYDSYMTFDADGSMEWMLMWPGGTDVGTGTFGEGAVNTFGIMRDVPVVVEGEQDTLKLLEYEDILNVSIVVGSGPRLIVPHAPM